MDRFLNKRPKNSDESGGSSPASMLPPVPSPNVQVNTTSLEFNVNEIVSDPGDQQRIEIYDARIGDRVRREYIS